MGLYDMAMIKDNHIKMAGSIAAAVEQVRSRVPSGMQIEVETTNLDEVKEALERLSRPGPTSSCWTICLRR